MLGLGTVAGGGDLNTVLSLFAVLLGLRLKPVLFGQSNNRGNSERALLCWLSPTSIETGLSAKLHSGSSSVIPNLYRDCLLSSFSSNNDLNNQIEAPLA